jgi:hypothetical protein
MAKKHRIVHSEDATTIVIEGDRRNPEPGTVVVKFPGGHIEVSRCTDGSYWAHVARSLVENPEAGERAGRIVASRIDHTPEAWRACVLRGESGIPALPADVDMQHLAVQIAVG